jgi:hypothetical protein
MQKTNTTKKYMGRENGNEALFLPAIDELRGVLRMYGCKSYIVKNIFC